MPNWLKTVSKNIKRLKEEIGINQDQLAEKAGCSKSVIRDLEAGSAKASASLDMLEKIATEGLGVSLEELLRSEQKPNVIRELPVSKTLKKMLSIPDSVYDEAGEEFSPQDEVWDTVIAVLKDAKSRKGDVQVKATRSQS